MKKALSLILALLCVLSLCSVGASAAEPEDSGARPIHVYDLIKYDADGNTNICRTIEIMFEYQYQTYDPAKTVTFQNADGAVVAECRPYADNNRKYDLYTPDGVFGVRMNPSALYYLVIPEGAYSAADGTYNASYRGEYNGIYLSNTGTYTSVDAKIGNFLAGSVSGNRLYSGKIIVGTLFTTLLNGKNSVQIYLVEDKKETLIGTGSVTDFKSGLASVTFDGLRIDRYASYKLRLRYGTLLNGSVVNNHSDYALSGKKLLGLSEKYPAVDFLVAAFGADHWTLKAYTGILDVLAFLKIVDKAMVKDVKKYIDARK